MNIDYLLQKIKMSGYRITSQRKNVLNIFQKANKPLTLKEVEKRLLNNGLEIDNSTTYRIIELFIKLHILIHTKCSAQHMYKLYEESNDHEVNLICTLCGKTKYLSISTKALKPFLFKSKFMSKVGLTKSYGICGKCQ